MPQQKAQLVPQLAHVASCGWWRGDGGSMRGHLSTNHNSSLWHKLCLLLWHQTFSYLIHFLKEKNERIGVWYMFSNNNFQFLNNIIYIFTHFLLTCISIHIFKQQFSVFKCMYQTPQCQTKENFVQMEGLSTTKAWVLENHVFVT